MQCRRSVSLARGSVARARPGRPDQSLNATLLMGVGKTRAHLADRHKVATVCIPDTALRPFAYSYHALFGEVPSATLRRGLRMARLALRPHRAARNFRGIP